MASTATSGGAAGLPNGKVGDEWVIARVVRLRFQAYRQRAPRRSRAAGGAGRDRDDWPAAATARHSAPPPCAQTPRVMRLSRGSLAPGSDRPLLSRWARDAHYHRWSWPRARSYSGDHYMSIAN